MVFYRPMSLLRLVISDGETIYSKCYRMKLVTINVISLDLMDITQCFVHSQVEKSCLEISWVQRVCESLLRRLKNNIFSPVCKITTMNNKRPMGHIAPRRKQFKSINTYDYIITLIKRRKKNHY